MKYLIFIDGMRALAVLLVIATHLDVSLLPGGFVGVDIFFVISGFLISKILLDQCEQGNIRFSAFYWRRARRLFPAMAVTVLVSVLVGFLLFSNEQFSNLIDSSIFSIFSLANIYFWSQVGYFDATAATKPLLHLWSLGVEEQFYLFWPFVLYFSYRFWGRYGVLIAVLIASMISFLLNLLVIETTVMSYITSSTGVMSNFRDGVSTSFYWFPFRIFEFGIGALLAYLPNLLSESKKTLGNTIFLLGLVLCIAPAMLLNEHSLFPYYNALFPAVGAGLMIFSGAASIIARIVFEHRVVIFLGKISYSLYLVHWPLIVYYKALYGLELDNIDQILLFWAMLFMAVVLNKTIETPLRYASIWTHKATSFKDCLLQLTFPLAMMGIVLFIVVLSHIPDRIPDYRINLANRDWRQLEIKNYCTGAPSEKYPSDLFTCATHRDGSLDIILWGDSHALHLVAGFVELFPDSNVLVAYQNGCTPQSGFNGLIREFKRPDLTQQCIERNKSVLLWMSTLTKPAVVIITSAKRDKPELVAPIINQHLSKLEAMGHQAIYLEDFIRPNTLIAQCRAVPNFVISDEWLNKICQPNMKSVRKELDYAKKLQSLTNNYVSVRDVQCPNEQCMFFDKVGQVYYRDHHHLSIRGAYNMMLLIYPKLIKSSSLLTMQKVNFDGDSHIQGLVSSWKGNN